MAILIVYYSRTGSTKRAALKLQDAFDFCDLEEIIAPSIKTGLVGFLKALIHAMRKNQTEIRPADINVANYDLVVVGTPIWAGNVATPVRTYLATQRNNIKNVAFFCTCGAKEENAFKTMEHLCGKRPLVTLEVQSKQIDGKEAGEKFQEFVHQIRSRFGN